MLQDKTTKFDFSTQSYKGTRDFYPRESVINWSTEIADNRYHQYIFDIWRKTLNQVGYMEYDCSVLENADIYLAKSGEELGSKQLYNFIDKGERRIALRPEMTPSLARMVADKQQNLRYPLRWFSIPNCFRYEAPQKGRLREHWQVNVDILGLEAGYVEMEILQTIRALYNAFGANSSQLKVWINSRSVLDKWLNELALTEQASKIYSVLDDWYKVDPQERERLLAKFLGPKEVKSILNLCAKEGQEWSKYQEIALNSSDLSFVLNNLNLLDTNFTLEPTIIRGQAYYTGMIFEVFDTNSSNPRSLFGGGRYDNLLDLFGKPRLPAVGFGSGDVTWQEFLTNWNLLDGSTNFEAWLSTSQPSKVGLMPLHKDNMPLVYQQFIPQLKAEGYAWDIDYDFDRSEKKRWETLKKRGCKEIIKI